MSAGRTGPTRPAPRLLRAMPRPTVRVRLTLLYTGLFVACGAVVIVITYGLVARMPQQYGRPGHPETPASFLELCRDAPEHLDEEIRAKCDRAFEEGVLAGAQGQREATLAHLLRYSLITLGAATLLAAFAGWIVAGRVLRPVHRITEAARTASQHHLSARVALSGPRDELRELADTFDAMLDRLEAAFESQRRFIANAGHELRTPLTVMRATLDVVLTKPAPTPDELRLMGRDVRVAVDQAERLIDALLTLARNERGLTVHEPVDLATVAEDVLDAADPGDRRLHATLSPAPTSGNPLLLERLVGNLVENALRYNVAGGEVWVRTSAADGQARLVVANTGPVVAPEAAGTLFEPFRRLHERTAGDGLGLGLALVASIAGVHGGTAAAAPRPGGGLTVTVTVPHRRDGTAGHVHRPA